ncbi:putative ABC-transporter type IV [Bifidobacterium dolichotidis]|uniref:Putative ABC-transporter type IV n=1 Tax=Bifidobacterium dolichotidis TaxID=2306976 RepID=A0A430FQL4_9BIFI|nr:putative ABC transporter permease [Bifidobacterium dolichotidis]RSX55115.1 putative ABC-transporter type IV [Bifidobacterium dolichotidis]
MPATLIMLEKVFLWFLFYSFVGWVWETVLNIVMKKRFVDRGMLNGPLCPIYGFGAMIVLFALADEHVWYVVFLSGGVLACTLEYLTSWGIEKLFHVRFWDYSKKPFNINGRVYLNGFLFFGFGAMAVKLWVQPQVLRVLDMFTPMALTITSISLLAILLVDFAVTLAGLMKMTNSLGRVEQEIKQLKQRQIKVLDVGITDVDEHVEAAEQRVHDALSYQQRRFIKAYPQFQSMQHPMHVVEQARKLLMRH